MADTTTPARRQNRSLATWDPLREMESLFGRVFGRGGGLTFPGESQPWSPSVDITETKDGYRVEAELPGVAKEDVAIDIQHGVLSISGERRCEDRQDEETRHRVERCYGSFTRSFALPENVDEDRIEASFKDGILTVNVPKAPESQSQKRRIEVQG